MQRPFGFLATKRGRSLRPNGSALSHWLTRRNRAKDATPRAIGGIADQLLPGEAGAPRAVRALPGGDESREPSCHQQRGVLRVVFPRQLVLVQHHDTVQPRAWQARVGNTS